MTPEPEPLGLFGEQASVRWQPLSTEAGIAFHGGSVPVRLEGGVLETASGGGSAPIAWLPCHGSGDLGSLAFRATRRASSSRTSMAAWRGSRMFTPPVT